MSEIRLKTMPYEFNGKTYQLCCNYNVLADIQEEFGSIPNLLKENSMLKAYPVILSAMLNDYADTQGWDEKHTPREVGRTIDIRKLPKEHILSVMQLVLDSLYEKKENTDTEPKN